MTNMEQTPRKPSRPTSCHFCTTKTEPSYRDTLVLRRYISDRGKLVPGKRTQTSSAHQRKVSSEVKKARFMALLPYTDQHML